MFHDADLQAHHASCLEINMPLLEDLLKEANSTDPAWLKKIKDVDPNSVRMRNSFFKVSQYERQLVQIMGNTYGCHTCNRYIQDTPQAFIVDHIPPRGLFNVLHGVNFVFFPHCDRCALLQANLVAKTNSNPVVRNALRAWAGDRNAVQLASIRKHLLTNRFTADEIKLLTGGDGPSIQGHWADPNAGDRSRINALAKPIECHSCGSKQASFTYHADHCPPKEFAMTGWFPNWVRSYKSAQPEVQALLNKLQNALQNPFLRPQCPFCSHRQGARCQSLANQAYGLLQSSDATTTSRSGRTIKVQKYS